MEDKIYNLIGRIGMSFARVIADISFIVSDKKKFLNENGSPKDMIHSK